MPRHRSFAAMGWPLDFTPSQLRCDAQVEGPSPRGRNKIKTLIVINNLPPRAAGQRQALLVPLGRRRITNVKILLSILDTNPIKILDKIKPLILNVNILSIYIGKPVVLFIEDKLNSSFLFLIPLV